MLRSLRTIALLAAAFLFTSVLHAEENAATKYPFAFPPTQIIDNLAKLNVGKAAPLSAEEKQFLDRAWSMKTGGGSAKANLAFQVDALLLASGVTDAQARAKYKGQLRDIIRDARKEINSSDNLRVRGEALMQFLHKGALKHGYVSHQSSLSVLLDDGIFNCVSSTAIYYVVGVSLELPLEIINIPGSAYADGHAALNLLDGNDRIEVEPTSPDGFDAPTKRKRPGVIAIGPIPDRKQGHVVDSLGLVAMIYANRGGEASKNSDAPSTAAARYCISALAFDPTSETAAHNATTSFVNLGPELAKEKRFVDAARVMSFAAKIAPQDATVKKNLAFVFHKYIEVLLDEGKDVEVVRIAGVASGQVPDDPHFKAPGEFFAYGIQKAIASQKWQEALQMLARGNKALPQSERPTMRLWEGNIYDAWAIHLADNKQYREALSKYQEGLRAVPDHERLAHNAAVVVDQWAQTEMATGHWSDAIRIYDLGLAQFPDDSILKHNKEYCAAKLKEGK